jgi:hypothetical protein
MPELTKDELKTIIHEVLSESGHVCKLSNDDITAIKTVSGFLTRCRNALGNLLMVVIAVVLIAGLGGVVYLVTGGHINLFKLIGL